MVRVQVGDDVLAQRCASALRHALSAVVVVLATPGTPARAVGGNRIIDLYPCSDLES